ncbi:MAG: allophanate hydrolase subunit 1 [Flavobacteriales bacterium CG_4_9_14_3_um_filter_40_17]|nr:MAG: allophanate hydrolase subunit 1 [Flavobacteriales bacterium CG_4_9_14_3_um_filter_40_17]
MQSENFEITFCPYGESAVLINWPKEISTRTLSDVMDFKKIIQEHFKSLCELVPSYQSLLVIFRQPIDFEKYVLTLRKLYKKRVHTKPEPMLWHVPVCYDFDFGIDLEELEAANKISVKKIIKLHTEAVYTVFAIGFLPGFMYLGGLPEDIHFPRKAEPRQKVCRGSVGIAGAQTGVYPQESPGGWNLIGNSPIRFFEPASANPCFVSVGDKIRFFEISKSMHELISIQVSTGVFELAKEVWHG